VSVRRAPSPAAPPAPPAEKPQEPDVTGVAPWYRCYAEQPREPVGSIAVPADGPWRVYTGGCDALRNEVVELFGREPTAGRTLAVLGNGLDQVYPAENGALAHRIIDAQAGALVSEFGPGIPPDAVNFPRRNRIISGLSLATVILEAGEPSGALITADFALEQGRDVLAVPGSIFSPTCAGTNHLLKQGATPVTCVDDILDALSSNVPEAAPKESGLPAGDTPELAPDETTVWHALSPEPRHIDTLARDLTMRPGEVSATLAVLELKGLARQVGSMLYTRA